MHDPTDCLTCLIVPEHANPTSHDVTNGATSGILHGNPGMMGIGPQHMDDRRSERVEPDWRAPYEILMFALMIVFVMGLLRDSDRTMGAALGPYGIGQMIDGYLRFNDWRGLGSRRHPKTFRRWGAFYMAGGFAMVLVSFSLLSS